MFTFLPSCFNKKMDSKFVGRVKADVKIKARRNRNANIPNHRWTEAEVLPLLQFLKENQDFEKPSARIYYNRFIENAGFKFVWLVVKSKVRHLRTVYCKALSWQAGASGATHEGRTTEEMLNHICPFFDICHEIWGNKIKKSGANITIDCDKTMSDSQTSQSSNTFNGTYLKRKRIQLFEDPDIEELRVKYEDDDDNEDGSVSIVHQILHSEQEQQLLSAEQILLETSENGTQVNGDNSLLDPLHNAGNNNNNVEQQYDSDLHSPTAEENAPSSDESCESNATEQVVEKQRNQQKKKASHTTLQDLLLCQMDRQKLHESKLELEKCKFQFEKEKAMRELELREKEILLQRAECAKDERLKILEIESKERIAMRELELKYKEKM